MSKKLRENLLKISEMAQKAEVLVSTIRYYTDIGLIKAAMTTEGGHRLYEELPTMERLNKIKKMVAKGMTLPEIQTHIEEEVTTKKILVVDDEPEIVDFIRELMVDAVPHQFETASDGFTAGHMIHNFAPDIVILDLLLPGVDGFQVCRMIREDPETKNTKILAVTGYDSAEIRNKIIESGADDYLGKPLDYAQTLDKICKLLGVKPNKPLKK
ncbi:MAG: Sensor histidine kinase RcsC [Elusimicrobia bacterium]|nr:Sensor histidine kinase RcsC [Elusimicrobiota bacterium]